LHIIYNYNVRSQLQRSDVISRLYVYVLKDRHDAERDLLAIAEFPVSSWWFMFN